MYMKFGSTHYFGITPSILECRASLDILRLNIRIILSIKTKVKLGVRAEILTNSGTTVSKTAVSVGPVEMRLNVSYKTIVKESKNV